LALGFVTDRNELAADKLLALFGRAAPRDFADVYRLRAYYDREELSSLAGEKDRGFNEPSWVRCSRSSTGTNAPTSRSTTLRMEYHAL
jgi:predicted nucleotidyltransferase component of viral defense system